MKILIVSQTFPLNLHDSTAHFMYDFAKGFADLGHKTTVLLPYHPKLKTNSFEKIKIKTFKYAFFDKLHLLGFGRTLKNDQYLKWFVYLLTPFYLFFGTLNIYNIVKKNNIDVINAHWILPNGFMAAIAAKLLNKPLFITLPGSDVYLAKKNIFGKLLTKITLLFKPNLISNSPQLLKDLGIRGKVISYGVPENHGRRIINKNLVVATAGRPVEKKGFEKLKKIIPNIEIISGLSIDEFREKLLSVDIFIAYSIRDSKGNLDDASLTILEAMAAGCAVITTDLPGNRNWIQNGVNGLLVKNVNGLKLAIEKLKKSKNLRDTLGTQTKKDVAKNFTLEKIAKKYVQFFEATTM